MGVKLLECIVLWLFDYACTISRMIYTKIKYYKSVLLKNTFWLWRYSNCLLVPLINKKKKSSAWVPHRKDQTTTSIWHNTVVPFIRSRLSCFLHVKGQRQSFWGFLCSQFKWSRKKKNHERLVALVSYHNVVMWSLPCVVRPQHTIV